MSIYLDHAASTPMHPSAVDATQRMMKGCFGNPASVHSPGKAASLELETARSVIATAIGAKASEIVFTSGGSESNCLALHTVKGYASQGNHIIVSSIEHNSILGFAKQLQNEGYLVSWLGVDTSGMVNVAALASLIRPDTVLVSVMHANNEIGVVQPIAAIGALCRSRGILFHTDACQSFLKESLDISSLGVDLVSLSGHKVGGPKGIGALYVREGVRVTPLICGGDHESSRRGGTQNLAGAAGFAAAVAAWDQACVPRMRELRDVFISLVREGISDVVVNGSIDQRLCNNIHLTFPGIDGQAMLKHLDAAGVFVSVGSACDSKSLEPSHVLLAMGRSKLASHQSLRFTLGQETTEQDIREAARSVLETYQSLIGS
ncbi:cysteine desulfurase [Candidatus Woesearchaeota archaeon]|nr:cysteine desulfurase [Candidatus Woesearchaeota archaeon]